VLTGPSTAEHRTALEIHTCLGSTGTRCSLRLELIQLDNSKLCSYPTLKILPLA